MAKTEAFYRESVNTVVDQLQSNKKNGLTSKEVETRLQKDGPNQLQERKRKTWLQRFIAQFEDFMIIVLMIAAIVAAFSGEVADAVIILAVVILNALFGVFQESKAEESIDALKEMSTPTAHVIRDGITATVSSTDIVIGDIVTLEAGDVVPADMRLIESASLKVEESALTGESVPVTKDPEPIKEENVALGDQKNMLFMNSNVTYGRAKGIVTGTGMKTEVGQIAGMLNETDETRTPLQDNLNQLGKTITYLILGIAVIVFVVGLLRGAETWQNMLLTAISLAVAAIPEGLPAIVTITLALGTQRMTKHRALVRNLPAVETLGSTDIIASDKTGTLTQNKMTVEQVMINNKLQPASDQIDPNATVIKIMNFANDTKVDQNGKYIGDPTETALVQFGKDHDFDLDAALKQTPRVAEIPFDSERKLMTTIQEVSPTEYFVTTKGAPDELLKRCTSYIDENGDIKKMTDEERHYLLETNTNLAKNALRVLAMGYRTLDHLPKEIDSQTIENDLIFTGLVAMIDPERPEVADAVKEAQNAGIRTIMITGDHAVTAEAIAGRLGIIKPGDDSAVITGAQLDAMSQEEFDQKVEQYSVYARVAPENKVQIVKAWQKKGKVVAMTGDGVNDAPALKAADIGVGMGITGTEVSKGASDMVLADDNFATIVEAVKEGRKVFSNIQKALQYLLSANLGEVITLFMMTILGWQILAPVQILWINLVTDTLPAIALGVEPAEPGIMNQKPRGRNSTFFSGGVFSSIIYQGILEGGITLFVYWLAITFPVHTQPALAHADALTMAYATLGLIQLFHAFNVKSLHQSIFTVGLFKNKFFNWSIFISTVLLAATIIVPGFNKLFHVTELDPLQWGIVLAAGLSMVLIVEVVKAIQRKVHRD